MKKLLNKLPGINSSNKITRFTSYLIYGFISLVILAIMIPSSPILEVYATSPTNSNDIEIKGKTRSSVPVYLIQNNQTILETKANSSGEYSLHLENLPEGEHAYSIESCESLDRKHCTTQLTTLTVDRTAPRTPILANVPPTLDLQTLTITGESDQNAEVVVTDGVQEYKTTTTDQGSFTIEIQNLKEGKNELAVSALDKAGNRSERVTITTNIIIPEDKMLYKVVKVVDGDTIKLSDGRTLRYIGIDTPETVDPRKAIQCYGKEASDKNKELVEGKEVRLEKDVSEKDKYGRSLRYVYLGDTLVNDYLVRNGYAKSSSYPPDIKHQDQFREAEQEARENKLGMWGDVCDSPSPTPAPQTIKAPVSITTPTGTATGTCSGPDKDCGDFATHTQAQAFYEMCGSSDPHRLDADKDGIACETLP